MADASSTQGFLRACPDERTLSDFACGKLSSASAETIAEHVGHCANCETNLVRLDAWTDPLLAAVRKSAAVEDFSEGDSERAIQIVASLYGHGKEPAAASKPTPTVAKPADSPLVQIACYRLLSALGEGGMGTVYKARHIHLDKVVAIKLLAPGRTRDPGAVARFQREMRAIGHLEHPNVVCARDAGESDGHPFLVMDYIDGVNLAVLSRRFGPLPVAEACELMRQAACGLQHAHENGLVHRDVKPSNLMLSRTGQVKLLDLGLALLAVQSSEDEPTATSLTLGTVDYMSPEQARNSHQVDIRADLYSLGCTLYRLLAGHPPFVAPTYDTPAKKLLAHATAPVPQLQDLRPDVPAELDSIVRRLLAKAPSRRYQTPAELMEALAPFAAGYDFSRLDSPSVAPGQPLCTPRTLWSRKRLAATVGAALLAVVLVVLETHNVKPPPEPESQAQRAVAAATPGDSPRRKAAEWVLSIGGSLTLFNPDGKFEGDKLGNLPQKPFSVFRVFLSRNERLCDDDVARLMQLGNFQILNLSDTKVSDVGLASLRGLTTLTIIDLADTRMGDAGLGYLAGNNNLRILRLTMTGITDAGLAHISNLKHLADLQLGGTLVTDVGLTHISGLTELVDLYLHDTRITDVGLAQLQGLTHLRHLTISGPAISDVGITQLVNLRELTTLSVRGTRCTDVGLERLQALPQLEWLGIAETKISDAGVERFQGVRPHCKVDRNGMP